MKAAIRAVTRSALDQGTTVYGVRQGWRSLVDGEFRQPSAARPVASFRSGARSLAAPGERISRGERPVQAASHSRRPPYREPIDAELVELARMLAK